MMPRSLKVFAITAVLLAWGQPVWAQTANYHLERLGLQARVFSESLNSTSLEPVSKTGATVSERLQQSVQNSVWARQMVSDDVDKILEASQRLVRSDLNNADPDELLSAKSSVDALARRLRVSSSALSLTPQSKTDLGFLMLELEESSRVLEGQREQRVSQQQQRSRNRNRSSWGMNLGLGYGSPWGAPLGWGVYQPYGNIYGPGPFWGYPYGGGGFGYPGGGYCR